MKIEKFKQKAIEHMPVVRGFTNWSMRKVKAIANLAVQGGGAVVPLAGKIVSVVGLPFVVFEMVRVLKEVPSLAGRAKAIPIMMAFGKGDDIIFGLIAIKDWIAEAIVKGSSLTPALTTATTVMSVAAVGLIAIGLVAESLGLRSLSKQQKKFQKIKEEEGLGASIAYITKKQEEMKRTRRIFNAFTAKQSKRISKIFNSNVAVEKKDIALKAIQRRFSHLKKTKALAIAIAIFTVVGVLLLTFLPTPLAPVAWAVVGLSGVFAISRMIHYLVVRHRFNKLLKNLAIE